MPRAGRCPQCGEPVSPFAAGCAICGADLERHRREQAERAARRPALPTRSTRLPALDDDHVMLALTALLVALAPLLGLLLAALGARDPRRANVRTLLVVLGVVAVAMMIVPALRFGLWPLVL